MRFIFLASFVLLTAIAGAQVKMSVEMSGHPVGTASITQVLKADGSKSVELRMDLTAGAQKLTLRSQNTYDRTGLPTRKFLESIIPGGKMQKQVIAGFDKDGANVVILDGGQRSTKKSALAPVAPRANASEFWLIRDKPKVGDKVESYVFNMDTMAWDLQTVEYKGLKSIQIGGKTVKAHEIETTGPRKATAYLDDKGLPWMIESGATTMKRISEN